MNPYCRALKSCLSQLGLSDNWVTSDLGIGSLFTKFFFSRAFFLWKFLEDFINGAEVESLQILNNSFHFPTRQLIPNNPF